MPAIIRDGAAVEIYPGVAFVDAGDIRRPANWLDLSNAEDRADAGVLDIVEPPAAPESKILRITGLDVVDGAVVRTFVVEDAPAPPPEPVPSEVADWQFAGQAAQEGFITRDEALAWSARGEIPKTLDGALAKVVTGSNALFDACMILAGAKAYRRDSPLVPLLAAVFHEDDVGLDQFWRDAGKRGV